MKKKVRLTEKDLHNIVKKSVYRVLKENEMGEKIDWKGYAKKGAIGLGLLGAAATADNLYDINQDDDYDPQQTISDNEAYDNDLKFYDEHGYFPDDSVPLYEKRLNKIVKESITKILKEMKIKGGGMEYSVHGNVDDDWRFV